MGIDYCTCKRCGEAFPDVIDYVICECGEEWCSDDCAESDGYEEDDEGNSTCKYCRKEDFEDSVLLKFALDLLNTSRDELIADYKELDEDYKKTKGL